MKDWLGKMRLCVVYAISTSDTMCCLHMIIYIYSNVHEISVILIYCLDMSLSHCKFVSWNFNELGGRQCYDPVLCEVNQRG